MHGCKHIHVILLYMSCRAQLNDVSHACGRFMASHNQSDCHSPGPTLSVAHISGRHPQAHCAHAIACAHMIAQMLADY